MSGEKRERGAPRRGPYGGKNRSFATKLTDETMERLAKQAIISNMSISQTAEVVIVRGLDAEDDFQRHFAPPLRAFEAAMIRSLPAHDQAADHRTWPMAAKALVARLTKELEHSIAALDAQIAPKESGKQPPTKSSTARRRRLDLD